jgi:hypothetical protein
MVDNELSLRDTHYLQSKDFLAMAKKWNPIRGWFFWHGLVWSNLPCIWNTRCKVWKVLVDDVIDQLDHLNTPQKTGLRQVLSEHTKLFDGTLGVYPHRKFHIDLVSKAVPNHFRPYAIPVIHLEAFKKEFIHLVEIGVLSP